MDLPKCKDKANLAKLSQGKASMDGTEFISLGKEPLYCGLELNFVNLAATLSYKRR